MSSYIPRPYEDTFSNTLVDQAHHDAKARKARRQARVAGKGPKAGRGVADIQAAVIESSHLARINPALMPGGVDLSRRVAGLLDEAQEPDGTRLPVIRRACLVEGVEEVLQSHPQDGGLRRLAERAWAAYHEDPGGVITEQQFNWLREAALVEGRQSVAVRLLDEGLTKRAFTALDRPTLMRVAAGLARDLNELDDSPSRQACYEAHMREAGLAGPDPHHVRARAFVAGVLDAPELMEGRPEVQSLPKARAALANALERLAQEELDPDLDLNPDLSFDDDVMEFTEPMDEGEEEEGMISSPLTGEELTVSLQLADEPAERLAHVFVAQLDEFEEMTEPEAGFTEDDFLDEDPDLDMEDTTVTLEDPSAPGALLEVSVRSVEDEGGVEFGDAGMGMNPDPVGVGTSPDDETGLGIAMSAGRRASRFLVLACHGQVEYLGSVRARRLASAVGALARDLGAEAESWEVYRSSDGRFAEVASVLTEDRHFRIIRAEDLACGDGSGDSTAFDFDNSALANGHTDFQGVDLPGEGSEGVDFSEVPGDERDKPYKQHIPKGAGATTRKALLVEVPAVEGAAERIVASARRIDPSVRGQLTARGLHLEITAAALPRIRRVLVDRFGVQAFREIEQAPASRAAQYGGSLGTPDEMFLEEAMPGPVMGDPALGSAGGGIPSPTADGIRSGLEFFKAQNVGVMSALTQTYKAFRNDIENAGPEGSPQRAAAELSIFEMAADVYNDRMTNEDKVAFSKAVMAAVKEWDPSAAGGDVPNPTEDHAWDSHDSSREGKDPFDTKINQYVRMDTQKGTSASDFDVTPVRG